MNSDWALALQDVGVCCGPRPNRKAGPGRPKKAVTPVAKPVADIVRINKRPAANVDEHEEALSNKRLAVVPHTGSAASGTVEIPRVSTLIASNVFTESQTEARITPLVPYVMQTLQSISADVEPEYNWNMSAMHFLHGKSGRIIGKKLT